MSSAPDPHAAIEKLARDDRGRLLSALISSLNNFDLAEEALANAFESALIHWARSGIPDNPHGWLLRVARRKAIDRIRRNVRFREREPEIARLAAEDEMDANQTAPDIPDKRLELIFTCCHPALDTKSRVALTLRTVGGLKTPEIARAFLDKETTMGQRLSRARKKITLSGIPFSVPGPDLWEERLASVLAVIYLIFNEGYVASSGEAAIRVSLCEEAIYLARLLDQLRPDEPEIMGLLSLMLTTHARRGARLSNDGASVALEEQDRELWDKGMIEDGVAVLEQAMALSKPGPYQIKAAISALHVAPFCAEGTDWAQISLLYDSLLNFEPTPVVFLNRAVAMAEAGDIPRALEEFERFSDDLDSYQPFHAARAEYLIRFGGDVSGALKAYDRAIELAGNAADRAFLVMRRDRNIH